MMRSCVPEIDFTHRPFDVAILCVRSQSTDTYSRKRARRIEHAHNLGTHGDIRHQDLGKCKGIHVYRSWPNGKIVSNCLKSIYSSLADLSYYSMATYPLTNLLGFIGYIHNYQPTIHFVSV